MKIGIDARMYNKKGTGISRYIKQLIENIKILDNNNLYVIFLSPEMYKNFSCTKNMQKICINAPHYSIKEQTTFLLSLYKQKLDLVHFTHFNAPLLYFKKNILTVHDITLSKFPGKKMGGLIHRIIYTIIIRTNIKKASHIITVSSHTKKDLVETFKTPSKKITPIHLGVDEFSPITNIKKIEQCKKKFNITKPSLLYVGVWRTHKNIVNLIKAFNLVKKELDIQILLTGKKSPHYPEITEEIKKSPYTEDISTLGFVSDEDLKSLYASVDALINPSFYEGFGIPPIEAMASNTIAIISNVTSHPEVCEDAALYFDPNSIENISQIIQKALSDERLQKVMREKGKEHVKKFRWEKMVKETLEVYEGTRNKGQG